MKKFDLIVVGAGIAGLSAALVAAQNGKRVALVEKQDYIGGIAQDCFNTHICGLFTDNDALQFQIANSDLSSNKAICSKIFNYLYDCYGEQCLVKIGKVQVLAFAQKDLWNYFEQRLNQEDFTLFKNAKCTQITRENRKIQSLTICGPQGTRHLAAPVFINATGGVLVNEKIQEADAGGQNQLGGYCILLKGESKTNLSLIVPYTSRKIVEKYALDDYLKFVTITYNFLTKQHVLKFSVKSCQDIEKCEFIYQQLNKDIEELSKLEYLKSSETIHLRACDYADHMDTKNEIPEDCTVKSYWPKEKWDIDKGTQYEYCKKGQPFCIPVSALKDANFDNLFLAGKSIRVPGDIHASARVMGVCMATGEQASFNALMYLKST